MFFKKKIKIIEKKYCSKCKSTENLQKYSSYMNINGEKVQYYTCASCNSEKHMKWYNNGKQKDAQMYNKRYEMKKKGLK